MNFFEFNKQFATELDCINHFIKIRYNDKPTCNHCGCTEKVYHMAKTPKNFICFNCNNTFSIFTGTIFEKSCTDLRKWFYAIHLFLNSKKGISSLQLKREISVTVKCAWRMLRLIRDAFGNDKDDNNGLGSMLKGIVEADECYIGGNAINKHMNKRIELKGKHDKQVVVGMVERGGKVKAFHVESAEYHVIAQKVLDNVEHASTLMTDEHKSYVLLRNFYHHKTINHSQGKYVKGNIYTNTIEGFWGTLKRGIVGIYHHVSPRYLQRYINEFAFRYNNRDNGNVFDLVLKQAIFFKPSYEVFN